MKNDSKYPRPEQYWPEADKLLTRHFRRKRILMLLLLIAIPAFLIGITMFLNREPVGDMTVNEIASSEAITLGKPVDGNHAEASFGNNPSMPLATTTTKIERKPGAVISSEYKSRTNGNNSSVIATRKVIESKQKSNDVGSAISPIIEMDVKEERGNFDQQITLAAAASSDMIGFINKQPFRFFPIAEKNKPGSINKTSYQKETSYSPIGWELTVYGSVMHVQKSLQVKNDLENYLAHRKNEEEPVLFPSAGISISGHKDALSLRAGVEISVLGERTNYYPYSNQQRIIQSGNWDVFTVMQTGTDTAYLLGNQFFVSTSYLEEDSTYVLSMDTVDEYRYDEKIAAANGVNRLYYLEFPIEVSYCFTSGRAGIGASAGISPAMLVHRSGHYLRDDGKGINSFDDISDFRKFTLNGRLSADFYYRMGARTKLVIRPQLRANLNSVFKNDYPVRQKYYSTGVLFGVSYLLN